MAEAKKAKAEQQAAGSTAPTPAAARLLSHYRDVIVPAWLKKHNRKSPLAAPRLLKITLNMGVGAAAADKKVLENAIRDLTLIAGQKPLTTRARKSIASYKTRKGYPIGCKATLRRRRMYEFLDRLITVALPRSRDFRGLPARAFDGRGNYSLGIAEQIVFAEIEYENIDKLRGLDVCLTTSAKSDDEARELLLALGLPIRAS